MTENVVGANYVRTNSWRLGLRGWECSLGHKQLPSARTCRECKRETHNHREPRATNLNQESTQVMVYEAPLSVTS